MTQRLLPLCAALLLAPATALAAPVQINDEGAEVEQLDDQTRQVTFTDDETVEGENFRPGGTQIRGAHKIFHKTMFTIRSEFIPELIAMSFDI